MRPGVSGPRRRSVFEGELFGAERGGRRRRSRVQHGAVSGYQEVLTDPSYAGQIVTFTNPHIGNYGVNAADFESRGLFCRGVVVRDLARRYSNRRAEGDLDAMLRRHGIAGITGIDTRRLTRLIRTTGAVPGAFGPADDLDAVRRRGRGRAGNRRRSTSSPPSRRPSRTRCRLPTARRAASSPTTTASSARSCATSPRSGRSTSCRRRRQPPTCWPANPTASSCPTGPAIRRASPRPRTSSPSCSARRCRCSASASATSCWPRRSAATTVKLPFGHHGANHPVQDLATGRIEITSQNHNFAVAADGLAGRSPRSPTSTSTTGSARGSRRSTPTPSPCSTTPRPGPGRTTAPTCSSASPNGWPGARR